MPMKRADAAGDACVSGTKQAQADQRSSPAVYQPIATTGLKRLEKLERVKGIEPSYSAWKAAALPLSYTRAALHNARRDVLGD
jgi:hypothetical protein